MFRSAIEMQKTIVVVIVVVVKVVEMVVDVIVSIAAAAAVIVEADPHQHVTGLKVCISPVKAPDCTRRGI